ncbi:DUF1549 domain-containing protein [Blastopirellula sp. JC732]|uniref:DUF1549 domain-containing protein n=1 Tax=Blastopirellula sediminis TaxID=2894196 RepID=A0A9X1MN21_9BACT|nr:DUF1549 domain-containing protein [Blastopirellula sediminis]MCC9606529.1 DUF1549 domain-containing protein [Blastopirellula sediminis]MCC9630173.1 DUF1549 domain-containing protein [Blastopirellula sediminis]
MALRRFALVLLSACLAGPQLASAADVLDVSKLPGILLDDAVAVKEGAWHDSKHTAPYVGQGYVHSGTSAMPDSKESKSLTFATVVPEAGEYEVFLAFNGGPNRAEQAPIIIQHQNGESRQRLNQRPGPKGPASFQSLGKYHFPSDEKAVVKITNDDPNGIIIADAVLLVAVKDLPKLEKFVAKTVDPGDKKAKQQTEELATAPPFERIESTGLRTLTSRELDDLIDSTANVANPTPPVDDETFLRRATIDVIGRVPTEAEWNEFLTDASPDKRAKLIDRLLASEEFGANWANYWSDVFSYRTPQPELTFLSYDVPKQWIAEQLNNGVGWDEVSYDILTGVGKVADNPAAFYVGYHQADISRLAGESTRIFLGAQIQCAECHDHPFVAIPQERFHQMAAFFVRTKADVPWNDSTQIVVKSKPSGEHKMPESKQIMLPAVFDGEPLAKDTPDIDRRVELAKWVVAPENSLFAKAYVNRIWDRLMDRPFCEPVDEITELAGFPTLPEVHNAVAEHFVANKYDSKSLLRLILNSQAYQRQLPKGEDDPGQLEASAPEKMRSDEIFASLAVAIDLPNMKGEARKPTGEERFPPPPKSTQDLVRDAFGYDPSLGDQFRPQTMQQAMFMMNNRQLQAQIAADEGARTKLAQILAENTSDDEAIERLFVNVLGRRPTEKDVQISRDYLKQVDDRAAAFEDLLWSLINSAEFTTRR